MDNQSHGLPVDVRQTFCQVIQIMNSGEAGNVELGVQCPDILAAVLEVTRQAFKQGAASDGERQLYLVNYVVRYQGLQCRTAVIATDTVRDIRDQLTADIESEFGRPCPYEIVFYAKLVILDKGYTSLDELGKDPTSQTDVNQDWVIR